MIYFCKRCDACIFNWFAFFRLSKFEPASRLFCFRMLIVNFGRTVRVLVWCRCGNLSTLQFLQIFRNQTYLSFVVFCKIRILCLNCKRGNWLFSLCLTFKCFGIYGCCVFVFLYACFTTLCRFASFHLKRFIHVFNMHCQNFESELSFTDIWIFFAQAQQFVWQLYQFFWRCSAIVKSLFW